MIDVSKLWSDIGEFDKKELDNSKDMTPSRWEARESARMEAYVKLVDGYIDQDIMENGVKVLQ